MMVALLWHLFTLFSYNQTAYHLMLLGTLFLWIGCGLQGVGFHGFGRNYGLLSGEVAYISSLLLPIVLLITAAAGMVPASTRWGIYYYSRFANLFLFWGGLATFGVMAILWGTACIQARKFARSPDLLLAGGIIYIIAGSFMMTYLLAFVGFTLMFISGVMIAVAFSGYGITDLVFSYILMRNGTIDRSECARELGTGVEEVDSAIKTLIGQGKLAMVD
jgi:hypothetical protein